MNSISAEDIKLLIEELRDESFHREYQNLRSWMEIDLLFQQAADALEKQAEEMAATIGDEVSVGSDIGNLVTRLKEGTTGSEGITKTDRYINSIMHEAATALVSERAAHEQAKRELAAARRSISATHKRPVTHENCERQHCPICEGGLFQCADCGAIEIETEQRICTGTEARIAELEKALERIVALDNQIDVTLRGKRKVVYGVFAKIARRALGGKTDD